MHNRAILVVEDHALSASLLLELLRYEVPTHSLHLAVSASQACSEFVRLRPSLVVMDIGLPGVSGLEATRWITTADPAAAVIMYSANDSGWMREAAVARGARGFVGKSDPSELIRVVLQCLAVVHG